MSHATLLVIYPKSVKTMDDVQEHTDFVMSPFNENIEVEPYIVYKFADRQKLFDNYLKKIEESDHLQDEDYLNEWYYPYKEAGADYWFKNYLSDGRTTDAEGNIISTYNPESKWDWWVFGGRWNQMLIDKNGTECNICKWGEFDIDKYRQKRVREHMEYLASKNPFITDSQRMTEEEAIELYKKRHITTHAVMTEDGTWIEPAEMGWFGCTHGRTESEDDWNKNYFDRFLKNLDPEQFIAVVDYHI